MQTHWVSTEEKLPPEGRYVLVHLSITNWGDSDDPKGVYFQTAKLVRGLSLEDRERMKKGELPDPVELLGDGTRSQRSRLWQSGDEGFDNNEKPYIWDPFGPGKFVGQDVDCWMDIPCLTEDREMDEL